MDGYDPNIIIEGTAFAALRKLQEDSVFSLLSKSQMTGTFAALREMQSTLSAIKAPIAELNASIKEYQKIAAPIDESLKLINTVYAPVLRQALISNTMSLKAIVSGVQASASVMSSLSGLNLSNVASILDQLPKYDFTSELETDDFTVDEAERLYENGEITQEEINEEVVEIINKKQFSPKAEWDKFKKSKWFLAIKVLMVLLTFACRPVIDYTEDKVRDAVGITQMLDDIGIYEFIDSVFDISDNGTVSEEDAKATVDEAKTGNISKQKREDLLAKIKEIRTFISSAPQDENTGNLLSYLSELEKDVCGKKYGLVFEEHREDIDEVLDTHTPVLSEDEGLFIDNGGQMNFLIEGDNLASLQLLEKTHKGRIDLIYIDPPYNTGNKDFMYDDSYVDANDTFKHSKWVAFMEKRLRLAKKLLSDNGIIFISINNYEFAQLKLLCDEIFDENNFLGHITWESTTQPINAGTAKYQLQQKCEPIYCYAKNKSKKYQFVLEELESEFKYPHQGKYGKCRFEIIEKSDAGQYKRDSMKFRILGQLPREGKRWQIGEETARKLEEAGRLEIVDGIVKKAVYPQDEEDKIKFVPFWSHLPAKDAGTAQNGKDELNTIMERAVGFDTVKPVSLIRSLAYHLPNNITLLDFFAGSGTTGHAVMKLNAEDGGSRRFILCTNNENDICRDITYERIRRVIDKEGYEASLKYYKVEYIPISDRMYYEYADDLLLHIRELVELENGVNFTGNAEIGIVLTEEELDEFIENVDAFAKCKKLYIGHDLLPTEEQEQILKSRDIEISIIPDYYYRDLQEG